MRRAVLAASVALGLVLVAGGAWWAFGGDGETTETGTCGNTAYEMSTEDEDGALEVNFELQSAVPGETWDVVVRQDGTTVLEGRRTTDEDAELDIDVLVSESDGTSFTVTVTPESGQSCTHSLSH